MTTTILRSFAGVAALAVAQPRIKVNEQAVLRSGGRVGWVIRKNSPQLQAILDDFYKNFMKRQNLTQARLKEYYKRIKQLKDPTRSAEWQRFEQTLPLFRKYGEKYHFEPLMLAAQGFQESQLNQNAKSHVGAIGVMQIMPATGSEMKVGDIATIEPNIHAGAKYMDWLMTQFFQDAKFTDTNRALFRGVQRGPRQHFTHAQGGREARTGPGSVVQQRGASDRGEDRHRDHDLRTEHLQVLRRISACDRSERGAAESGGSRQGKQLGRTNRCGTE